MTLSDVMNIARLIDLKVDKLKTVLSGKAYGFVPPSRRKGDENGQI
jgi:hypothetical protein